MRAGSRDAASPASGTPADGAVVTVGGVPNPARDMSAG
jgi:hypothetical protein